MYIFYTNVSIYLAWKFILPFVFNISLGLFLLACIFFNHLGETFRFEATVVQLKEIYYQWIIIFHRSTVLNIKMETSHLEELNKWELGRPYCHDVCSKDFISLYPPQKIVHICINLLKPTFRKVWITSHFLNTQTKKKKLNLHTAFDSDRL